MLNYLVSFSTWAESNSGQIQILIGILALSLAIFGYTQIIEQIKIAKKQEDRADEQRKFELKIQSLNMSLIALDKNALRINNFKKILKLSEGSIKSLDQNSEVIEGDIRKLITLTKEKINHAEEVQEDIFDMCKRINRKSAFHSLDELTAIYDVLISIINDANNTDLMRHHFTITED